MNKEIALKKTRWRRVKTEIPFRTRPCFGGLGALGLAIGLQALAAVPPLPENRAHEAEVSSDSEFSADYAAKAGTLGFDSLLLIRRRPLNPSHVYTYHVEGLAPGGGLFTLSLKDGKLTRLVDASEGVILDCQVSFDGRQILFSWKRSMQEPFKIWRVNVDGSGLACVIDHDSNNMNACWLPDGGIAFMSDRKPAFAYCWTSTSPVLYRADRDGRNALKLSANYLTDFTPSIMADGRILFSRWEYVDRPAIPIQSLWAINPDGTSLAGVFGNRVLCPATFMEAKDIPGMPGKILCVMTSHNGPCRGAIGLLDLTKGGNAQESILNLTPEVRVGRVDDAGAGNGLRGPYESPVPLGARYYLVSREGRILLRDYLTSGDRLKILMWIDLNVPFYGTSQSRQPELRGCRRVLPKGLDETLKEVAARRKIELPTTFFVRLDHPEKNPFLAIPLAKGAFASRDDPDYRKILACFDGVQEALALRNHVDYRQVMQGCEGVR